MPEWHLRLTLLPGAFAICRLPADAPIPIWASGGSFVSITRTANELSVVCRADLVPAGVLADTDWRCLRVEGPFDLTTATGVLASIASPLAAASISLFALATFDTDYILIHAADLECVRAALAEAGHTVTLD
ncbi:MAG: ACT domain-containing protein [Ktedonobacterales bacterium]